MTFRTPFGTVAKPMDVLQQTLQTHFGLDDFRRAQREVIEAVLAGDDVLCVMPTGAGKSLCYQLPAVVKGGLSVVVSPLISLMSDQVRQLADRDIPALMLNSSMDAGAMRDTLRQVENGYEGLLFVAPERFFTGSFFSLMQQKTLTLLAIDEAHCISQWGHDFRPEYKQLGFVREKLNRPPCIALTATATEEVRQDVIASLQLRPPAVFVTGFDRPNLRYLARRVTTADRDAVVLKQLAEEPGSAIIYCSTRKAVEAVTDLVAARFPGRCVVAYHAGMDAEARRRNQEQFMATAGAVAVATNAFGMGINKPDTRLVMHYNIPGTLEAYYQEAGRAGRDGLPATCLLLFNFRDRATQEYFIGRIGKDGSMEPDVLEELKARAANKLEWMCKYAQAPGGRRRMILDYFGDETPITDDTDDALAYAGVKASEEVSLVARKMLSAVARMHGQFGAGIVAEVLSGSQSEKIQRFNLTQLSVHGLLKELPTRRIVSMVHRLIEAGLVAQKPVTGLPNVKVLGLSPAGVAVMKGERPVPPMLADLLPSRKKGVASSTSNDDPSRNGGGAVYRNGSTAAAPADEDDAYEPDEETLARYKRLKEIRRELATADEVPAYCVCSDKTLRAIARYAPRDANGLGAIHGMGPSRVSKYGQALLGALRV
ncbi:MAG: RecQ family ATP-dependent DNA helicase [Phycisphaerae bacterium]